MLLEVAGGVAVAGAAAICVKGTTLVLSLVAEVSSSFLHEKRTKEDSSNREKDAFMIVSF